MICGSHVEGAGGLGGGTQVPMKELQGKVSVWWDIENCPIPKNCSDSRRITCNIIKALKGLGYVGEISIHACGNTETLSLEVQNVLKSTGVLVIHTPSGKDAADKKIITDMMLWGYSNPPPASYLLISGDIDYRYPLERLKSHNFKIMLAGQRFSYDTLLITDIVWCWDTLLQGGELTCNVKADYVPMVMLVLSTIAIDHLLIDCMIHP